MTQADDSRVIELAEQAGIIPVWVDVYGRRHTVDRQTLQALLQSFNLPCCSHADVNESKHLLANETYVANGQMLVSDLASMITFRLRGDTRYQLRLEGGGQRTGTAQSLGNDMVCIPPVDTVGYHDLLIGDFELKLAIAPRRCPSVSDIMQRPLPRAWGIVAQAYGLWRSGKDELLTGSAKNRDELIWPDHEDAHAAGDYAAIAELGERAAEAGASALAISPVHAMFSADPGRYSPYSPSSRLFLNASYANPSMVLGDELVRSALVDLDVRLMGTTLEEGLIDWASVVPARMARLRRVYELFLLNTQLRAHQSFREFRRAGGPLLQAHACYEALHAHHVDTLGVANGWKDWPAHLQDPFGPGVTRFAQHYEKEVGFHVFLQWLADEGLRTAQQSMRQAGMSIGLITDLAIGADGRGSHAWCRQTDFLDKVTVGAPPDLLYAEGQNWGLSAFSPRAMRGSGYAPFLEMLRAVMKHAGGVRIDHILGFARMWLVPEGTSASMGAFVRYPCADMLNLLALEAERHKAIIVGENLGTVPEDFNEQLYGKGIMGTTVLLLEKNETSYLPLERWPVHTVAMPSTHDLPTLAGWWAGCDIQWRERLGAIREDQADEIWAERHRDKKELWRTLADAGLVTDEDIAQVAAPREALLAFIADAAAPLALFPLEDLMGLFAQPNLPGTDPAGSKQYPSWIQRFPTSVEHIFGERNVRASVATLKRARYAI
jgi:4-alpha-glucanotransferase|tara:strand:- start:21529 stop:23685 length:2157 start_codon:yes stop_codon:yes gene_type:complete